MIKQMVILISIAMFTLLGSSAIANEHDGKGKKKNKVGKMFDSTDTNQDGQLELSEFLSHAEARFKSMDLNQDGYVTKDEGLEAHKAMREKRKAERKNKQSESTDSE